MAGFNAEDAARRLVDLEAGGPVNQTPGMGGMALNSPSAPVTMDQVIQLLMSLGLIPSGSPASPPNATPAPPMMPRG